MIIKTTKRKGDDIILASELFGNQWPQENCAIKGITCDSRKIKKGDVFVCVKGENDSGYRYIKEAEQRGAAAIVADSPVYSNIPVILYCNPRRKMAELAKRIYGMPDCKMTLVGVTGTNGKTTVTHLIRDILLSADKKTALIGTNGCFYNRYLTNESFSTSTTPESADFWKILKDMRELGSEYAVCEVSSHALALDRVYGADFDLGVFTNLTPEHLDFHKNMESYFNAKKKLFEMCDCCVINTDDEYGKRLYESFGGKSISIGMNNADITAENVTKTANGSSFVINSNGARLKAYIPIPGEFSVYNALCAYAAGVSMGISEGVILKGLSETSGVKGRCERIETNTDFSVIIDYAHTPDGLEKIIKTLKSVAGGRVITLFGCGGDRDKTKRSVMGKISGENSDFTIITSDNSRTENPIAIIRDIEKGICDVTDEYIVIPDRYNAIEYALANARENDIVLLAGKGHEDYIIKGTKKIHFDEREAVNEILKRTGNR